jgi:hypothetical protein
VKGIYIKVPSNAEQLSEIRKWVQSAKADDIDQLEKYGLKGAMQYDYFVDTWIAWQSVADLIPHRFADPETFLKPGYIFDTSYDGSEYLLHITDVLHTGTQMPLEYARDEITEALTDSRRESYDNNLLRSLYRKAVTDKKLKVSGYVPQKFR